MLALAGALSTTMGPLRANDVDLSVSGAVHEGESGKMTLHVKRDVKRATAKLVRTGPGSTRESLVVRGGPTKAGGDLVLTLQKAPVGMAKYTGTLEVTFDDGASGSMPLSFGVETRGTLVIEAVMDKIDVEKRSVVVKLSRPASKVDIEVTGDDGVVIANQSVAMNGAAAGSELVVPWTPSSEAKVLRISLVGHDTSGFFSPRLDLHPWSLSIPHDEVVFASGQATVTAEEEPKLTGVLPELQKTITRYQKVVDVKLFIVGHTDTVGGAASNLELSNRRARALATWFQQNGVRVPIYARGFGESMLKKDTPDETDAVENRRADYVLAVNSPTGSFDGWHRVR